MIDVVKMIFSSLDDDSKAHLLSKFYPDCEETTRHHNKLLEKLLLLCEGNLSCVGRNHQRMKELCSINNADVFEFKEKIRSFANKYKLSKNKVFEILADVTPDTFFQIKMKYEHSVAARKMRKRLLSNDLDVSIRFDNVGRNIEIIANDKLR